jgi:hypothetical protein
MIDVNLRIENISHIQLYSEIIIIADKFRKNGYYIDPVSYKDYIDVITENLQKFYKFFTWGEVNQIFTAILSGQVEISKFSPENLMKIFASRYQTAIFRKKADEWEQKRDQELSAMFAKSFHGQAVMYRLNICKTKPELRKFFLEENEKKNNYKITTSMIADCLQNQLDPVILINN